LTLICAGLWHVILTLAESYGCGIGYRGSILRNLTYADARRIGDSHHAEILPELHVDCETRVERCPNFRFCVTNDPGHPFVHGNPLHDDIFVHKSVAANDTIDFGGGGHSATIKVQTSALEKHLPSHHSIDIVLHELGIEDSLLRATIDQAPHPARCPLFF